MKTIYYSKNLGIVWMCHERLMLQMWYTRKNLQTYLNKFFSIVESDPIDIQPWAFYTDGGVDTNKNYYFLQNVWKKTGIWYWTISHANVHVQSILKTVDIPPAENNPMDFLVKPKDKLKIKIPYEKYLSDSNSWFYLLKNFQIHLRSGGYNAYVRSFAVFYSESEVRNSKFVAMTKRFLKVKTFADLPNLKLDVLWDEEDTKSGVRVVEFDVSKKSRVERWLKTKDPSIYPLLWVYINQKFVTQTVDYKIKQNVAGQYVSIKLLTSSNPNSYSNIDLYNLCLKGIPLEF